MWVVVGLGNPGCKYKKTRHNVGFMVIDELALRFNVDMKGGKAQVVTGSCQIAGEEVSLLKPLTFMNLSGTAVGRLVRMASERAIIVQDDVDMPLGRLKIKYGGSSGGHRGVASIIEHAATKDFYRVKIGIGKDPYVPVEDYVLGKFTSKEFPLIVDAVNEAMEAIECIISEGPQKAMNLYNRRDASNGGN
ncbi:aminoacyl-tRNA hydrolase [Candidatus Magnetomonas plexicatena]|uniref:aminoacyl-tRNA hydrolase n=1 Tax=Candidatus Magnetomonas plexicatena TaxID=2552947 RepID=UPI001C77DCB0|nr:aminoacyl-tRNA hydrolase [Nitrospirales bacterium LBB_01]